MTRLPFTPARALLPVVIAALLAVLAGLVWPHQGHSEDKTYVISYHQGAFFHERIMRQVRRIYEIAGIPVRFEGMPHKRSLRAADSGEVDGEAGRIPAIEKVYPNLVRVNVKLTELTGHAYVIADSNIRSFSPSLLDGHRVGIVGGVQWATNLTRYSLVTEVADYESLFKLLEYDRVDLILATTPSADVILNQRGKDARIFRRLEPLAYAAPFYHYVHKKNAAVIPALERAARIYLEQQQAEP